MRFTEDQVRQALQHSDKNVRQAALDYFAKSFSKNTAIMPDAIDLIERLDPWNAFPYSFPIADLAQTAETIAWAAKRLQPPTSTLEEVNFCSHLGSLLRRADPLLVLPHESAILESHGLSPERASELKRWLGLASTPSDQLWQHLLAICEAGKDKQYPNEIAYAEAKELADALARDISQAPRMLEFLSEEVDPESDSMLVWLEIFMVRMAGSMRYEPSLPLIIKKFLVDGELLNEECVTALPKIGTDAVVQMLHDTYPHAPYHFRLYSAEVLGNIHSDLAISTGLELVSTETDLELKAWLATFLLDQFSTEAIDAGRAVLLDQPESYDLKSALVLACKLMAYDVPELSQWERDLAEPRPSLFGGGLPLAGFDDFEEFDQYDDFDNVLAPAPVSHRVKTGRNDPCPCGSGKKFKKCCLNKAKTPG